MKGQRDLRLHSDLSLVTGSVKLNDDYTGGDLYFPRQKFSNKDVPVGKCILFPGQVTHSHTSKELESGTKFSLTIWTKRGKNDG
jgi:predicted 2-oxoglutarate/Fe(II)-dependent dioxygenase YbiX